MDVIVWVLRGLLLLAILGFEYLMVMLLCDKLDRSYRLKRAQRIEKEKIISEYKKKCRRELNNMRVFTFTNSEPVDGEKWVYNKALEDVARRIF